MTHIYQQHALKYIYDILENRYNDHRNAAERCVAVLHSKNDIEQFMSLINSIYQVGFEKAAESYKSQLKKLGYEVKVIHSEKDGV